MSPLIIGIGALVAILVCLAILKRFKPTLIKVEQGNAIVRSRAIALPVLMDPKGVNVFFNGVYVVEAFDVWEFMDISVKTIDIDRRGKDGLICRDNIRADISVSFYVRVLPNEDAVTQVAGTVGLSLIHI